MQAKITLIFTAALIALVSGGAVSAQQKLASLPPDSPDGRLTIVPKSAPVTPDSGGPSFDSRLAESDKAAIKTAVRQQIHALAALDAGLAFAQLAPSAQSYFGGADDFLLNVAEELPPMLRTKSFAFVGLGRQAAGIVQEVLISDGSGLDWLAQFQLERQANGDWRVKSCIVDVAPGQQA